MKLSNITSPEDISKSILETHKDNSHIQWLVMEILDWDYTRFNELKQESERLLEDDPWEYSFF